MKLNKTKLSILIGVYIAVAVTIRIYYLLDFSSSPLFDLPLGPDVEEYSNWAKEIIAGRLLWPFVYIHAPLYPFFLAILYLLFSGLSSCFFWVRFSQILLGFLTFIPLAGTILLIFREYPDESPEKTNRSLKKMLVTFLLIWAWYPPLIYYLGELTSEVLLIPLLGTAVYFLYRGEAILFPSGAEDKNVKSNVDTTAKPETNLFNCDILNLFRKPEARKPQAPLPPHPPTKNTFLALAGICSGLATIAHPLALFFMFTEIVYLFLRRNFKGMAFFGCFACLMIFPVSFYNMAILKQAIPIQANGGFNLYLGNNEEADGTCNIRPGPEWDDFHLGADFESRKLGISKDSLLIQKTVKFILNHPLQWLQLVVQKAFFVWNYREITAGADLNPIRYHTTYQRIFQWAFGVCAVLALMAIFMNWTNWGFYFRHRHLLLLIGALWISQALLVTSGRYRISMVPCMLILTAWTITHIKPFLSYRPGNHIRLLLSLITGIAVVFIPRAPFNPSREEGETATILGEAYLIKGDYKQSEKYLHIAEGKLPAWSRNYNLLGMVKENQGKIKEAKEYYLKAVKSNPVDADAFMNLATLFFRLKLYLKAAVFFEKAFTLPKPHSADLYYNYAVFCQANNQLKKAVDNYLKCLKKDPAFEMALNNLGTIYFQAGKYQKAIVYFEKSLALNPLNTKRLLNLAIAKAANGDKEEAEILVDRALEIKSDYPQALELKAKLKK